MDKDIRESIALTRYQIISPVLAEPKRAQNDYFRYVDNGASFASDLLARSCAMAGISLIHSKPYDSPSRGKIERLFRTVRERFLSGITATASIDELNDSFRLWLQEDYHHKLHSGIGEKPIDRYNASVSKIPIRRLSKGELDEIFLVRCERIVNNDATISFKGSIYEVPAAYIRHRIEIRHPVDDPQELYLYDNDIRESQNAAGRHILMQPIEAQHFLLLDDISRDILCRHHQHPDKTWKPGRMVIETSPANFQVWIRSARPLTLKEKRFLITILKSDPSADPNNRFGRCPGFRNQKPCHRAPDGSYPLSRLIWVDWRSPAFIPPSLLLSISNTPSPSLSHPPPLGGVCHAPPRSSYLREGESQTDFAYALALVRRGYPDHLIRSLILNQRTSWVNHKGEKRLNAYLARTISRARAIIEAP